MRIVEDRIEGAGGRLFVHEAGEGDPLVLVHGGPGMSHEYMRPLETVASEGLRVVTYDQRGAGRSTEPNPPRYGLRDHVADLECVRRHLGVERMHLLGHSWGGLLAQAYAGRHPRRVASLTLVGTMAACCEDNHAGQLALRERVQELTDLGVIPDPLPRNDGDSCKASSLAMLPAYLADPDQPTPAPLTETSFSSRAFYATVERLGRYELRPKTRDVAAPCTVYVGQLDPFGTDTARAAARGLPNAFPEVVVIPRVGHYPWLEGDGFVHELRRWLERLRERGVR